MATTVIGMDEFRDWYHGLPERMLDDVTDAVGFLEEIGTALGHPRSAP